MAWSRSVFMLSLVCCLALLALAGGCAGSASAPAGQLENTGASAAPAAEAVAPRPLAMPSLPSPGSITRGASVIEGSLVLNGASFRDDLTHQLVSVVDDSCIYDPSFLSGDNPLYSEVALAIYSFDVSSVSSSLLDASDLDLDGRPDLVIGTARVFAGVPSPGMDKWDWSELHKSSSSGDLFSWSWGESHPSSLSSRAPQGVLNVCVVVFGDTALDVSRVALSPPSSSPSSPPVMQELFRKGWDGTVKCPCAISVDCDDTDRVHASCYDSSNGQLYYFQADGRVVREMCADCDSSSGMSNDLCVAPDGSLLLAYTDDNLHQGVFKTMAPDVMSSLVWSPRSNFDNGDDGTGVVSPVGSRCRTTCFTFDTTMFMCVAYENTGDGSVRLATRSSSSPDFSVETVSPVGELSSSPVPVSCPDGVCVLYLSRSSGGGGGAGGFSRLMLAQRDAVGAWFSSVLADDVQLPNFLDPDDDCDGFCDGSVKPGTNELVAAYSSPSGISFVHFDLSSHTVRLRESPTLPSRGGGAFLRLSMMGDGSVRLADYAPSSRTIYLSSYFENGDIPTEEQFVSLPAVQLDDNRDEDCDGLDLWVDPDDDGDGFHQTVLVSLTSSMTALGQSKKEFKGHVTLLK